MSANPFGMVPVTLAPDNDSIVGQPPGDTISCMRLSPRPIAPKMYLATSSWDNELRAWEVDPSSGQTRPVGSTKSEGPLLWCNWSNDGQVVYFTGCDKKAMAWHLPTQQKMVIGTHDEAIRSIHHCTDTSSPCVVTGGWDRKIKYWDVQGGGKQIGEIQLPERVFAMDVRGNMCVVGLAERTNQVYDLRNPGKVYFQKSSQLRHQTRAITSFPNQEGYIYGSVEGRVGVDHISESRRKDDFAFKCRDQQQPIIWPVHCIRFYPAPPPHSGVFATGSGGGACYFWNKDEKSKLRAFTGLKDAVTSCDFSYDGKIFAYATGYDWSKGADAFDPSNMAPVIRLHAMTEDDLTVKIKPSYAKGR